MFLTVLENEVRSARPNAARRRRFDRNHLEIRMFNVDHGEAILVTFDNNRSWLIDAGCSNQPRRNTILGQRLVQYLEQEGLLLEAIVPTHPHVDHAGAFATILGSGSPNVQLPTRLYRSEDRSWHLDRNWLFAFWNEIFADDIEIALKDAQRVVDVSADVSAQLFAGSGDGPYTSLFVQIRYHDARILFTGDTHCEYEKDLLQMFGDQNFRADVYKVTHHGSSSGTAKTAVDAAKPGIAIASTGHDAGHRLEKDTLKRLGGRSVRGRPKPRRVFECLVDGDIIIRTDGRPHGGGILYQVEFETPGRFANDLNAEIQSLSQVNRSRTESKKHQRLCS